HGALLPAKGVTLAAGGTGAADDLAAIVDCVGDAADAAGQRAQIRHGASVPDERVARVPHLRPPDDASVLVDVVGHAEAAPWQRAEQRRPAVAPDKRAANIQEADNLASIVVRERVACAKVDHRPVLPDHTVRGAGGGALALADDLAAVVDVPGEPGATRFKRTQIDNRAVVPQNRVLASRRVAVADDLAAIVDRQRRGLGADREDAEVGDDAVRPEHRMGKTGGGPARAGDVAAIVDGDGRRPESAGKLRQVDHG